MKCFICENNINDEDRINFHPTTMHKIIDFDEKKIVFCSSCVFGVIDKPIENESLEFYYSEVYSGISSKSKYQEYKNIIGDYPKNKRAFSQISLLSQFLDKNKKLNVLEIGSGRGDFMKLFLKIFNKSDYYVSETQEQSVKVLKMNNKNSVNLFSKKFDGDKNLDFKNKFDLIFMSHSLEHFNPNQIKNIVSNIYFMLNENALFFCEVPNADLRKFTHEAIVPHLSFFSQESFEYLCKDTNLKILFNSTCGDDQLKNLKTFNHKVEQNKKNNSFQFIPDSKNQKILWNIKTIKDHKRYEFKGFLKYLLFRILGSKNYEVLLNRISKYSSQYFIDILSSKEFKYHNDGEYIRIIAKKEQS